MRKITVFLLFLFAMIMPLAGCRTTGVQTTPTADKTTAPTQAATAQSDATAEPDDGIPDYLNMDGYLPIVTEGNEITLSAVTSISDTWGIDPEQSWLNAYIEQKLNVNLDIEGVGSGSMAERRNLMFASQELPDMLIRVGLDTTGLVKYGQMEGQLLALNDYIDGYMPTFSVKILERPSVISNITCPDGNIYSFPQLIEHPYYANSGIHVNQEWLDALDMDAPETLDEFYDMLTAFKQQDPGNVGEDDVIALGGCSSAYDPSFFVYNAMGFMGVGSVSDPMLRGGEVAILAGDELFRDYLSYLRTLYEEGLLDKDFFTMDNTEVDAQLAEGLLGVYAGAPYTILTTPEGYQKYVALAPLTSDYSDTRAWPVKSSYGVNVGMIALSSTCAYPEVAARLCDWFYTPEGTVFSWTGPSASDTDSLLGMLSGWTMNEDNAFVYLDVESGKYDGIQGYLCGAVTFSTDWIGDASDKINIRRVYYGLEYQNQTVYNPNEPYQYFRLQLDQSCKPYYVDSYPSNVYFTEEEAIRLNELKTVIGDFVKNELAKFVTGSKDIETELDAYYDDLGDLGFEEYLQYYVTAYDNYRAALGQ